MTSPQNRKKLLKRIREVIREQQFTPRDLSIPAEADIIMVLLALDEFPYKMPHTKLAIVCYIGSRGTAIREELLRILRKDYSTIAHNLIDLEKQYNYISHSIAEKGSKRTRIHTYSLTPAGKTVFADFCYFYQQKILETISTFRHLPEQTCANATLQHPTLPL